MKNIRRTILILLMMLFALSVSGCFGKKDNSPETYDFNTETSPGGDQTETKDGGQSESQTPSSGHNSDIKKPSGLKFSDVPAYNGETACTLNGGKPYFDTGMNTGTFEYYGDLDNKGRCTVASASLSKELMPTEKRGDISRIHPTGWVQAVYECVEYGSLYNRSHLIAFALAGENDNERNLITGTRYMNAVGMQEYEILVGDYIKKTGNHVLYRVTPIFEGDEPLARGVNMEAWSVEDKGKGICFNVFCYNVQPDIIIDYATGDSDYDPSIKQSEIKHYVLNTGTKKFHDPDCPNISDIYESKKSEFTGTRDAIVKQGYVPCNGCRP
ncbi:MAG: DNA/RNA non-specific endonuclease [Lachnospiraceae bacterium]|nr:DNA/RNA non-specific endonuclease [Lachnospiraceae bacterium]